MAGPWTEEGDVCVDLGAGGAVPVTGAHPGEKVEVEVDDRGRGRVVRVLESAAARVPAPCPHFGPCGGCSWQHVAYAEQLRLKRERVARALRLALGRDVAVAPTLGLEPGPDPGAPADPAAPWGFRAKAHYVLGHVLGAGPPGGGPVLGHYARGTRTLLPVAACPVHDPRADAAARAVHAALVAARVPGTDERALGRGRGEDRGVKGAGGGVRHVIARAGAGGQVLVTLVATRDRLRGLDDVVRALAPGPGGRERAADAPPAAPGAGRAPTARLDGLHLNVHDGPGPYVLGPTTRRLAGRERLLEELGGARFLVAADGFFQTAPRAAARLLELVLARVPDDGGPVLDLFAGVGLFALPLALRGHRVLAVEESAPAVAAGEASLRLNAPHPAEAARAAPTAPTRRGPPRPDPAAGLAARCRFVRARAERAVRDLVEGRLAFPPPAAVVLDPPRDGCPPGLLPALLRELHPPRVVYVSCAPDALARDLAEAERLGWALDGPVAPVDMFPHTPHVEAVAVLAPAGREPAAAPPRRGRRRRA